MASDHEDPLSTATRALVDATTTLSRLFGEQARTVVPEVGDAVAQSLREASRGLAQASESMAHTAATAAHAAVDRAEAGARAAAGRAGDAADRAEGAARSAAGRADDRRRQKVDRTRADLLAAAARVIAAKGYEGASVGDIAAEAGYTKGAVYAHFASKEEVFLTLARDQLHVTIDSPDATLPGVTVDGVDEEALTHWLCGVQDDPRVLLSLEFLAYGLRHPEASGELARLHVASHQVLAEQVAEVRRARQGDDAAPGTTQDDYDTALAVISVLNVAALEGRLTGSPHLSPQAGARIIARLLS
ncbi:TetR/AcrR family transcriptional regulator [Cellulomonas shaoxiangyii]|uniref:TetR/AcrR family transcriptional regulator n=1 Tax=Cellulomonas shaoxiangyii TaxID=2566013 RepID=A0A4P7SER9_9CELL|nr:TetR/AcrR family transcriptional regulator [Cellulomonas shaoxiangyii]QCB92340.1 TetR/AcrR family transcriptional regulator [Cellulomonas shaoxiangyii]TGY86265.1 TetR/AcrR family transcriptional regulator [Cellulomonas shaoxiangyii]